MVLAPSELQEAQCAAFAANSSSALFRRSKRDVLDMALEIWLEIFSHLEAVDLLRCSQVCRQYHTLITSCTHLQYTIELFAAGLSHNPSCTLSSSDRLQLLHSRRDAWRTLSHTSKQTVRMSGRCHAYELVDGVFAKSARTTEDTECPRRIVASRLPSRKDGGAMLMREDVGLPARDFAMDPSQDLIVLVHLPLIDGPFWEVRIHVNTLSTGKRHPEAAQHVLTHPLHHLIELACVQIADDVVGFWYLGMAPGLVIWNWKSGETLVTGLGDFLDDYCDFTFLSPRSFLLTNAARSCSLDVFTFASHPTPSQTPTKVTSLLLPQLAPGVSCENILVHTGPFVAHPPASSPDEPFYTAPWARILAVSLTYRSGAGFPDRWNLFVHARTLSRFADACAPAVTPGGRAPAVGWTSWGPHATRIMPQCSGGFQWLRYVHGERVVLPPMTIQDGPHAEWVVRVLDFRVHPRRHLPPASKTSSSSATHDEQSTSPATQFSFFGSSVVGHDRRVFADPVETRLPCMMAERQGKEYRYSGFMIDEQRLVGLRASAFSEEDMGDLDVFTF